MPIPFTALVASLPAAIPFVAPEAMERERGRLFRARIGANESAFGISPKALAAIIEGASGVAWYGDPENHSLREALAARHGVSIDEICVDAGIDSLLGLIVRMLVAPGASVVTSRGAYPTFNYHVAGFGGVLNLVDYNDDHEDALALVERGRECRAPLIYLANPDNPMGTWHAAQTIDRAIAQVSPGSVLALDEAYAEFAPAGVIPGIDTRCDRVLRLRTFSKAYGMAGMRIGYAIGHRDLITGLNKVRNQFAVNRLAQAAALASLHDDDFLAQVQDRVQAGRERIYALAARHELAWLPSATNFVAVDLGTTERATRVRDALLDQDVFVRMPGVAPLNRTIRIGVGRDDEHEWLSQALASVIAADAARG